MYLSFKVIIIHRIANSFWYDFANVVKKDYLTNFKIKIFCDIYIHQNELTKDRCCSFVKSLSTVHASYLHTFLRKFIEISSACLYRKQFIREIKTSFLLFLSKGCTVNILISSDFETIKKTISSCVFLIFSYIKAGHWVFSSSPF